MHAEEARKIKPIKEKSIEERLEIVFKEIKKAASEGKTQINVFDCEGLYYPLMRLGYKIELKSRPELDYDYDSQGQTFRKTGLKEDYIVVSWDEIIIDRYHPNYLYLPLRARKVIVKLNLQTISELEKILNKTIKNCGQWTRNKLREYIAMEKRRSEKRE